MATCFDALAPSFSAKTFELYHDAVVAFLQCHYVTGKNGGPGACAFVADQCRLTRQTVKRVREARPQCKAETKLVAGQAVRLGVLPVTVVPATWAKVVGLDRPV